MGRGSIPSRSKVANQGFKQIMLPSWPSFNTFVWDKKKLNHFLFDEVRDIHDIDQRVSFDNTSLLPQMILIQQFRFDLHNVF